MSHYNASVQVFAGANEGSRVVWIADLLPHDMKGQIEVMIEDNFGRSGWLKMIARSSTPKAEARGSNPFGCANLSLPLRRRGSNRLSRSGSSEGACKNSFDARALLRPQLHT